MENYLSEAITKRLLVLVVGLCSISLTETAKAQVTVCYGQDNCKTVTESGTEKWSEERARQKTIRDARDSASDAAQACNLTDNPEACRGAYHRFLEQLNRKEQAS